MNNVIYANNPALLSADTVPSLQTRLYINGNRIAKLRHKIQTIKVRLSELSEAQSRVINREEQLRICY
jgi:hypothetical protein